MLRAEGIEVDAIVKVSCQDHLAGGVGKNGKSVPVGSMTISQITKLDKRKYVAGGVRYHKASGNRECFQNLDITGGCDSVRD